eukprot:1148905-Pelagomonas_calceolata.AAC.1
MTAIINECPCPPVRDFEHEGWTRLVRGVALALIESRRESKMVANTAQLPVPGELRERYFLPVVGAGLWIVVAKVGMCDGAKIITEMWIGIDGNLHKNRTGKEGKGRFIAVGPLHQRWLRKNDWWGTASGGQCLSVPNQYSPTLKLKVPNWRTWAYPYGSCQIQNGIQEIGAGVYCPLTDSRSFVKPNGAGITNTICRAELAAISAAVTHSYSHIASDSLTSLHQI